MPTLTFIRSTVTESDRRDTGIPVTDIQFTGSFLRDPDGKTLASLGEDDCWVTPDGAHWNDIIFTKEP